MPAGPNVLWIFCDELRADAIGCYGNEYAKIVTPAIDSIAAAGTRFDRFYVNSPVCVPSRATYLTGQLPSRTGIYHNEGLSLPDPASPLSFVEQFRDAGYLTVNLGKEHVPPGLRKFDTSDADGARQIELMIEAGAHRDELDVVAEAIGMHSGTFPSDVPYPPDKLTDHALRWLHNDRPEDQPWLLRVSYLQPHTPVVVPEPWASRYDSEPWPDEFGPNAGLSEYERAFAAAADSQDLTPAEIVAAQSCYHGLVSWIDDQVERLLGAVDDLGLRENTIVVFASDHGAQLGELGGAYGKMTFSDWSHRVPFIVSWPGHVPAGELRPELAQSVDFGPTLCDLIGLDAATDIDGRRLFTDPAPDTVSSAIGYGNPSSRALAMLDRGDFLGLGWPQRFCVRTERWRYDRSTRADGNLLDESDQDRFLADGHNDPREEHNVVDDPANGGIVAELEEALSVHLAGAVQTRPDDYALWRTSRGQHLTDQLKGL
jgi:choline-sulfatase